MTTIRILPEILANKIAAGEVVERPASVVKELVENALDAGSTRILIDIRKGGSTLIQVSDNGTGMTPDDAMLALERFATSKIRNDEDLFAIETLGFRGEALPSIAAVSKMTIVTRGMEADSGVEVTVHGGKILNVNDAGAPRGTMIRVAQLFYNTPARRKFLKSMATEMSHIADIVAGTALGRHQVHFKLTHNGKPVKQWPGVGQPVQRIADVLGQGAPDQLIELEHEVGGLRLSGCLGPARLTRSTSRGIYLFVNGRRVRDRVIQHALFEGYHGRLVKGQFPVAVIFITLPFDQVDVNVHPTKHEVRFADSGQVHNGVRDAVAAALRQNENSLWRTRQTVTSGEVFETAQPTPVYRPTPGRRDTLPSRPAASRQNVSRAETVMSAEPFLPREEQRNSHPEPNPVDAPGRAPMQGNDTGMDSPAAKTQQSLWENGAFADLTVIGQFHGTYIICQDGDDLILIDQHAAHERIVFERLSDSNDGIESQRLLMPETLELGFGEAEALSRLIPQLNEMGLEIEPFGGTTFAIKAVPTLLDHHDIASVVRSLAEQSAESGLSKDISRVLEDCRMLMACHHAVRANQHLAPGQITAMLEQLDQCKMPSNCPHGRPTWIRWSRRDLEKAFKRIVS
jgi:DNA mismatch repair protein MutL